MKRIIHIISIFLAGLSLSCNSDDSNNDGEFKSTGEIIGLDMRLCACCGG